MRRRLAVSARLFVAVLVATVSGCSAFWIEHVPDKPPPGERVLCTADPSAPILDSILTAAASGLVIGSGAALKKASAHCSQPGPDCAAPDPVSILSLAGIVTGAVLAVIFGASAAYGYAHTARCRALTHDRAR